MSDQVDEDDLSFQLETSLSLLEEEDDYIFESKSDQPLKREDCDVKENLLKSINALQTPIKFNSRNLRKKVLTRNMQASDSDVDKIKNETVEKVETRQEEKADNDELPKSESVRSDSEVQSNSARFNSTKPSENLSIEDILSQDFIIIDEFVDISSPIPVKEKAVKEVEVIEIETKEVEVIKIADKEDEVKEVEVIKIEDKEDEVKEVEVIQKVEKRRGLDVDYVSKDPLENADNNNPDWLILQKLETDEERYKAVRERWRNLIVPEPNKDLTCFAWCRKKFSSIQNGENQKKSESEDESQFKGRKRTFSSSEIESPRRGRQRENSDKRVRTVSCSRVYDEKIEALRRHVSEECLKIDKEQQRALDELNDQYIQERRSLSTWSLNTGASISVSLSDLDKYHYHKKRDIQRSYEDLSLKFLEKQSSQIRSLEDASAEVLAFHRFYQGLDQCAPEAMALTEEQSQEIDEINHMYEAFYKFYEE